VPDERELRDQIQALCTAGQVGVRAST
jgi:hypothetical protein